jgi:hypothetical protein
MSERLPTSVSAHTSRSHFFNRNLSRVFALLPAALVLACLPLGRDGSALAGAASSGVVTCKQITKAQVQPLMSVTANKVQVTKAEGTGQQCVYSNTDGNGEAIDVLVVGGSLAKPAFQEEIRGLVGSKVAVPGVGQMAYRAKGDFQLLALSGQKFCSVSVGSSDTIPGVAAIQEQNGGTSDLPESDNAVIAKALGTICNRVFKKGSTTVSLAALGSTTATTTAGSGGSTAAGVPIGTTQATKTASEDPLKVTLVKVFDPAVPANPDNAASAGMRWVGLQFTVVVNGPDSDTGSAFIIGSDGNTYGFNSSEIIGPFPGCADTSSNSREGKPSTICPGTMMPTGVTVAKVAFSGLATETGTGVVYWSGS